MTAAITRLTLPSTLTGLDGPIHAPMRNLEEGKKREDIVRGFVRSAEFKMLCDKYGIISV